jgi:hypothetical protein
VLEADMDVDDDGADVRLRAGLLLQRGQSIPPALLEPADPPSKWRRLDLELPSFRWRLDSNAVQEAAQYSDELRRSKTLIMSDNGIAVTIIVVSEGAKRL